MNSIEIDELIPALDCYFIDCEPGWYLETRRILENSPGGPTNDPFLSTTSTTSVNWHTFAWRTDFREAIQPKSLVVLGIGNTTQTNPAQHRTQTGHSLLENKIERIFRWHQQESRIVVIAEEGGGQLELALRVAGAMAIVTDFLACSMISSVIERIRLARHPVMTSWQTRFTSRLPWNPVTDSIQE